MRQVILGDTGIQVSRLCIGTGTNGWGGRSNQTSLGLKGLANLLRFAYEQGINFWDSADQYGSHPHIREALKTLDRQSVVITTKTVAQTAEQMRSDLDRFRQELNTDYLDIVLLHCMTSPDWPIKMKPVMEVLSEAKEQGIVRATGVSCHDFRAFQRASEEPWVEVVLARINYSGIHMDASPQEVIPVLEKMHRLGKGLYGMKVMGQGSLGKDPRKALRFVLGLPCVDAVVVGMESTREILENVRLVEEIDGALVSL